MISYGLTPCDPTMPSRTTRPGMLVDASRSSTPITGAVVSEMGKAERLLSPVAEPGVSRELERPLPSSVPAPVLNPGLSCSSDGVDVRAGRSGSRMRSWTAVLRAARVMGRGMGMCTGKMTRMSVPVLIALAAWSLGNSGSRPRELTDGEEDDKGEDGEAVDAMGCALCDLRHGSSVLRHGMPSSHHHTLPPYTSPPRAEQRGTKYSAKARSRRGDRRARAALCTPRTSFTRSPRPSLRRGPSGEFAAPWYRYRTQHPWHTLVKGKAAVPIL